LKVFEKRLIFAGTRFLLPFLKRVPLHAIFKLLKRGYLSCRFTCCLSHWRRSFHCIFCYHVNDVISRMASLIANVVTYLWFLVLVYSTMPVVFVLRREFRFANFQVVLFVW